jgi:hypothetical protein
LMTGAAIRGPKIIGRATKNTCLMPSNCPRWSSG